MASKNISDAINILRKGEIIIFPTETVYGIGCDLFNKAAVSKIFKVKKRDKGKPLQVLISNIKQASMLAKGISPQAKKLMKQYFPGPLTIVLKKRKIVPSFVTAGKSTIAIRCPDHPLTLKLLNKYKRPIVGTSANISGKSDPHTAKEAVRNLKNKVDYVLDGGRVKHGIASTIVDATGKELKILRKGPIKIKAGQ